jgi:prepilin-type processing-associated H-X9-DG protein
MTTHHCERGSLIFRRGRAAGAFTLMEALVIVAIILVLTAIAVPIVNNYRMRANRQVALDKMKTLGSAISTYTNQQAGALPAEDVPGADNWGAIAKPEAADVWYNALPRLAGKKGAGDLAMSPEQFYSDENLTFLPGANYPDKKKFVEPLFAIAFNTKLQRKELDGTKKPTRMEQITQPSRTVLLMEQGLLNEDRTVGVQTKKDYDGAPKGSAKSFVGRYGGKGFLLFADGHVDLVEVSKTLTETGDFPYPQTDIVWTRTPEENPNKDDSVKRPSDKK